MKIDEVSYKLGKGRHTTKAVEMIEVDVCNIIDIPGFSSIKINYYKNLMGEKIDILFKEFHEYISYCQFSNCDHIVEKGCKIIEIKNKGELFQSRYGGYRKLLMEIKKIKEIKEKYRRKRNQ